MFDESFDARTKVHEYGGAAALVHNGVLYFSFIKDCRIYRVESTTGAKPVPITPGMFSSNTHV